jgi:hypothetical protein
MQLSHFEFALFCSSLFAGGKQAKELIDTADSSALEDLAERELLNAARIIKEAAEFLLQAR